MTKAELIEQLANIPGNAIIWIKPGNDEWIIHGQEITVEYNAALGVVLIDPVPLDRNYPKSPPVKSLEELESILEEHKRRFGT